MQLGYFYRRRRGRRRGGYECRSTRWGILCHHVRPILLELVWVPSESTSSSTCPLQPFELAFLSDSWTSPISRTMSSIARVITKNLGDFPLDHRSCQLLGPTALVSPAATHNTVSDRINVYLRSFKPSWAYSPFSRSSTRGIGKPRSVRGRYGNAPHRSLLCIN